MKVSELEDELRELFTRRTRKDLTGVLVEVSGNRRLLVRFQYGGENDPTSNKLTIKTADRIPVTKETEVVTISTIPKEEYYL